MPATQGSTGLTVTEIAPPNVTTSPAPGASYSGTGASIVTASVAVIVAAANAARKSFMLQNTSTGDLWFRYGAAPTVGGATSFKLAAGLLYEPPLGATTSQQIQIVGATAGQTFSYMEC